MLKKAGNAIWGIIKAIAKSLYSLIKEPNGSKDLSLGRLTFIALVIMASVVWVKLGRDIPPTMETFLGSMLVYVFGGKVIDGAKDIVSKLKSIKANITKDEENDGPEV